MTTQKRRAILVSVLVLGLMAAISAAVPFYQQSAVRAKEAQLKNSLFTLRTTIDKYQSVKKKLPILLNELVTSGYLREVPVDPITGTASNWRLAKDDSGIFDVHSGSDLRGLDGSYYSEW